MDRVTASSGLSRSDAYTYDRNGNRLTAVEGGTSVTYTYDRADQAIEQTISGVDTGFAYNAWGDLTSAADRDNGVTAHTYDAGSRLVSLTVPAGGGFGVVHPLTYDALGRPATRDLNASTTYAYVGVSSVSYAVSSGGGTTYGLLDADGSRLALHTGGTTAWTSFDLHGNLVGATASGSGSIVSALRYDAYGATLDAYTAGSGATETPWRYQGRLDLSPDADEPLYDYGARRYRPSTGAFTALDTHPRRAADPRSMNRFLYAHANPTTLVDPTGYCVGFGCSESIDGYVPTPKAGKNAAATAAAARAATSSSSSWAPAAATNTANTADALARAAQQAKANKAQAGELERFRNFSVRVGRQPPAVIPIPPYVQNVTRGASLGISLAGVRLDAAGRHFAADASRRLAIWNLRMASLSQTRYVGPLLSAGTDALGNVGAGLQRGVGNAIAKTGRIIGWGGAVVGGVATGLDQWQSDSQRDPAMPDGLKGVRATVAGTASTMAAAFGGGAVGGACLGMGWCAPFVVPVTVAAGFVFGEVGGSLAGFGFDILDAGVSLIGGIRMPWDSP